MEARGLYRSSRWPTKRLRSIVGLASSLLSFQVVTTPTAMAQVLEEKLVASDGEYHDRFAFTTALVSGWAFCGAPYDDDIESQSGAVYVFQESGSGWNFAQKLKASDPAFGTALGEALAASGSWMVAATPHDFPTGGGIAKGSAHVYQLQGGVWQHAQKVVPSDSASVFQEYFGFSVALRGNRMVIGEQFDNTLAVHAGSAYVFELQGATWVEVAKVYALDNEVSGLFGYAVAIDGERLVIGAPFQDNGTTSNSNRGAAYVFERVGANWLQTQKLVANDSVNGDAFGLSIAVSGDVILVGTENHEHSPGLKGAVYVFTRQGGTFVQTQELSTQDNENGDALAGHIAIEGNLAAVSAAGDDDLALYSGSAYVFRLQQGAWQQIAKVLAPDGVYGDTFANSLSLSGSRLLVGCSNDDDACPADPGCNSGSAYVFEFAPGTVQWCSCPSHGPCGNHDEFGGCANSIGAGGVLSGAGSSSVAIDDLRLEARWLPLNKPGIFFRGVGAISVPLGDGRLCVGAGGAGVFRFHPPQSSGTEGVMSLGPGVVGLSHSGSAAGWIAAGQTWHFQAWSRDPSGPCGGGTNLTNALRVDFVP